MKAMDHETWYGDVKIGFAAGVIAGVIKFLDIYLLTDMYAVVLLKVFFTAVIGGLGGVVGKHLFVYLRLQCKKMYEKYKNKKK